MNSFCEQTEALQVLPDADELSHVVAELVTRSAQAAVEARGRFNWVLAGGATPRLLYRHLLSQYLTEEAAFPWTQTTLFWGDERAVPPTHTDSNYKMAEAVMLKALPLRDEQVFRIEGELGADEAAIRYEARLRSYFHGERPGFDLVLLGLGQDGHTASLFPEDDIVLSENQRWVAATREQNGHRRITLTPPALLGASQLVFMVSGASKAAALARLMAGDVALPAAQIAAKSANACFFVDTAAAAQLTD